MKIVQYQNNSDNISINNNDNATDIKYKNNNLMGHCSFVHPAPAYCEMSSIS